MTCRQRISLLRFACVCYFRCEALLSYSARTSSTALTVGLQRSCVRIYGARALVCGACDTRARVNALSCACSECMCARVCTHIPGFSMRRRGNGRSRPISGICQYVLSPFHVVLVPCHVVFKPIEQFCPACTITDLHVVSKHACRSLPSQSVRPHSPQIALDSLRSNLLLSSSIPPLYASILTSRFASTAGAP